MNKAGHAFVCSGIIKSRSLFRIALLAWPHMADQEYGWGRKAVTVHFILSDI